jgi:hypothetical protein
MLEYVDLQKYDQMWAVQKGQVIVIALIRN